MNSIWYVVLFIGFILLLIGSSAYQAYRFHKREKKIPYKIPSMDHAVAIGLLDCKNCRHRTTCYDVYPNVYPDFEHKCGANFTFQGNNFYYTVADERIPFPKRVKDNEDGKHSRNEEVQ